MLLFFCFFYWKHSFQFETWTGKSLCRIFKLSSLSLYTKRFLSVSLRGCHTREPWDRGAEPQLPLQQRRGWDSGVWRSSHESAFLWAGCCKCTIWTAFVVRIVCLNVMGLFPGGSLPEKRHWARRCHATSCGSGVSSKPGLSTHGAETGWIEKRGYWWRLSDEPSHTFVPKWLDVAVSSQAWHTQFSGASSGREATLCIYNNHACSNGNIYSI